MNYRSHRHDDCCESPEPRCQPPICWPERPSLPNFPGIATFWPMPFALPCCHPWDHGEACDRYVNRLSTHIGGTTCINIDVASRDTGDTLNAASGAVSMTADANGAANVVVAGIAGAAHGPALEESV